MVMRMQKSVRQQGLVVLSKQVQLLLALVQCVCITSGFVVVPTTLEFSRSQPKNKHPGFSLSNPQQQLLVRKPSSSSHLSTTASSSSIHNKEEEESGPEDSKSSLWTALLDRFQGDFDNYQQVVEDRAQGLLPQTGGGHEHIHCCLVPVTADARLAAFYFDGNPGAIFRFRYYHLVPTDMNMSGDDISSSSLSLPLVDTVLYTLHPDLEKELRQCPDPLEWPNLFHNFSPPSSSSAATDLKITLLQACDVRWSWERDPIQHAYAAAAEIDRGTHDNGMHAVMVHGNATVQSQMMPGQDILIKDQLSLWRDSLWIHDRGYNPDTGAFIYGNQRGVPYRLQRVTTCDSDVDAQQQQEQPNSRRVVVDPSLAWTLGPDFRTPQEYEEKMAVIGGSSRSAR
jgi:hypothetical protein